MRPIILPLFLLACSSLLSPKPAAPLDPDIPPIQEEIAALDGRHGYYHKIYRNEESLYWRNIPGWMREDAKERKVARILDIGCGYGTLLAFSSMVYGSAGSCLDINNYLQPAFLQAHGLQFAKGNIELDEIPWGERFDVVLMTEVLEHFQFHPLPTLRKIRDALAPGGVFFLSTPDERDWGREYRYYRKLSEMPPPTPGKQLPDAHIWIYSKKELVQVLTAAGFTIKRLEYAPGKGARHFNVMAVRD